MAGISCLVDELRDIKKDLSKRSKTQTLYINVVSVTNFVANSMIITPITT